MDVSGFGTLIFIIAMIGFLVNIGRTFLKFWLKNQENLSNSAFEAQSPLTGEEMDQLEGWETNLIAVYVIGLTALGGWIMVAALPFLANSRWLTPILLGVFFLALGFALFLQIREKCPRCGFRIGLTSWQALPKICLHCRVNLKK